MTSAQQTDPIRTRLLARRAELEAHAAATAADRKPVELDQSSVGRLSRMDAMQVQAMSAAAQRSRENELTRISAALVRLDEGEFGYCVSCGDEIAKRRLDIDLTTATCIRCAAGRDR